MSSGAGHSVCSRGILPGVIAFLALIGGLVAQPVEQPHAPPSLDLQAGISAQLRSQPPKLYEFNRATLRDVLRFLADDAGISFVSLPESGVDESTLVTFTLRESPFRALEIIAKANGVALFYEEGVWYLRPFNDRELVGRTYILKYNTQEKVEYKRTRDSTNDGGGYGGSSSGGTGVPDLGISLQSAPDIFKVLPNPMINDIKALLGIPTEGFDANIAPDATVDSAKPLGMSPDRVKPRSMLGAQASAPGENGAQVFWNSDSNTLYVVATRQQHEWVEGYLASVDRPQNLIAIEVKFFETTKDPRKQIGLDWTGTMAEGYGVTLSNLEAALNFNTLVNPASSTVPFFVPATAVLSAEDIRVRLRAFVNDRETSTVSYPRVLTVNNREVVIRSVVNQPVLAATSSVTPGVGGTTTASIEYLPIGTIINILPKTLSNDSVTLNTSVTVSSIVGEVQIQGNRYPVATSRVYTAALQVDSGYTLAIGGLEEAFDNYIRNGIPLLKDVPVLGWLFKSRDRSRNKKNLMIFITPTLLPPRTTVGIPQKPQSVIPVSPADPKAPRFEPDGRLIGGRAALDDAVRWVARQRKYYEQIVRENRTEKRTIDEIKALIGTCGLLLAQVESMKVSYSGESRRLETLALQVDATATGLQALLPKAKKDLLDF